jgi:hypothetical protein
MQAAPFHPLGDHGATRLIYSAPALIPAIRTEADFLILHTMMYAHREPWTWLIDCRGMKMAHLPSMTYIQKIAKSLMNEHYDRLAHVIMLNVPPFVRSVLTMFGELPKVRFANATATDLHGLGLPYSARDWILSRSLLPARED